MRNMVEKSLYNIQMDNNKKLEEMRIVVDEKLQKSLNERMNQSFSMVSERLEQVYKGQWRWRFEKGSFKCQNQRYSGRNTARCNFTGNTF